MMLSMTEKNKAIQALKERDFTAGMLHYSAKSYIGTTGEKDLDEEIVTLAKKISGEEDPNLLAEMMIAAARIQRGAVTPGNFKLFNRALKEMTHAEEVFHPYCKSRKVAIYGSARTKPEEKEYQTAALFAKKMVEKGFMSITGAGPGIMQAGNEGAGAENSFGLNISLPFEAAANEFIAGDEKLVDFNFFFTRKVSFIKEADACVACPGGFGTMDEIFEALTLIQTGKASVYPVILLDAKGGTYWKFWNQFIEEHLDRLGLISKTDFSLFKVTDDVDEAVDEILNFYSNFHSYRYVGDQLVIRLQRAPDEKSLQKIQEDFAEVIKSGEMRISEALPEEADEPELAGFKRCVFRHRRRDYGKLRELIDRLNQF